MFFPILSMAFIFFIFSLSNYSEKVLNLFFFNLNFLFSSLNFSFKWDKLTIIFIFMVFTVVSLVSLFSEYYLEHYNMKKFASMKIFFFFSMITLTLSNNLTNLMIGWDWLGISSLFLIMFYPNKMTLFNSYLTMMFNRLGDGILILILCSIPMNMNSFILLPENLELIFLLFALCSLTKSAQFPLSSWLPAAMSAPTPISAMVHSSTLVTAGLYLVSNLSFQIFSTGISNLFFYLSMMSFILGGWMAKVEMDFKKIVAFSTLSQVSMIMYFFFLSFLIIGLWHMTIHAFFKTILFCCCGVYFISNFSDQFFQKMFFFDNKKEKMNWLMFLSIFSMSGLTFSSSFISKDKILEMLMLISNPHFLILMAGSILTLFYCSKILEMLKFSYLNSQMMKKNFFMFFSIFSLMSWLTGKMICFMFSLPMFPLCSKMEIWTLIMILFSILLLDKMKLKSNFFKKMTISISLMKSLSFSIFSKLFSSKFSKSFNSDYFIFYPSYFSMKMNKLTLKKKSNLFIFSYLMWIYFFF